MSARSFFELGAAVVQIDPLQALPAHLRRDWSRGVLRRAILLRGKGGRGGVLTYQILTIRGAAMSSRRSITRSWSGHVGILEGWRGRDGVWRHATNIPGAPATTKTEP